MIEIHRIKLTPVQYDLFGTAQYQYKNLQVSWMGH